MCVFLLVKTCISTKLIFHITVNEEAPENGKESPHSVHANGLD